MRKDKRDPASEPANGSAPTPPSGRGARQIRALDPQALLHELRVHQFELETQNEELRRARGEMEIALRIYTEIFDFSPIGYAMIRRDHVIVNVNLAAGEMLGRPRSLLNGTAFERLVAHEHRSAFADLLAEAWNSGETQSRRIDLLLQSGEPLGARLSAIPLLRSQPTLLLAIERLELSTGRSAP
jgi:PAS domain S-box-containing protein